MLEELKDRLYSKVPLTKYMQINPEFIDENYLITTAPLKPNINDKGTGFAGSLSTLVTISAWCACFLESSKLGYEKAMIAVIKSNTFYRAPVTKNLVCKTILPSKNEIEILEKKLKEKKSASLKIKSQILQDEQVCVDYEGIYVIKI